MFIEELRQTSIACPAQWEGRLADGLRVFVHYRSGNLMLGYGPTVTEAIDNAFVVWRSADRLAGGMRTSSMLRLTGLAKNAKCQSSNVK